MEAACKGGIFRTASVLHPAQYAFLFIVTDPQFFQVTVFFSRS